MAYILMHNTFMYGVLAHTSYTCGKQYTCLMIVQTLSLTNIVTCTCIQSIQLIAFQFVYQPCITHTCTHTQAHTHTTYTQTHTTYTQIHKCTHRHTNAHTHSHTHSTHMIYTQTHTNTHRYTDTHTWTHMDTQNTRRTHKHTHRNTH